MWKYGIARSLISNLVWKLINFNANVELRMEKPELTNGRRWLFATVLDELVGSELEGGEGDPAQRQRLNFLS